MKIYFIASLSGREEYGGNYQKIIEALRSLGHTILSEHVLKTEPGKLEEVSKKEEQQFYKQVQNWINEADVIVAEVSHPSTNVGHEISLGLSKNKPVVMLHMPDQKPILFEGLDSEKVQLIAYDPDTIDQDLKYALDFASEQQDTRFNFFISPKHQNYLDWIAKNKKIPRSVFLRRLIEQHMEENEEYNG